MRLSLLGIVEDGAVRDASLPTTSRSPLSIPRGQPVTITLRVVTAAKAPYDLTAKTVALYVRKNSAGSPLFTKTTAPTTALQGGPVELVIAGTDTANLTPGTYEYEVWVYPTTPTNPPARERVVVLSALRIEPSLTPP